MRIICDAPGQTCNRLWSYVASLSECIVKNKRMVIIFYDYTIEVFPNLRKSKYVWFPLFWPWYLHRGNGWNNFKGFTWKATHSELWDWWFKKLGFIKGWHTRRDTRFIAKAKPELKRIFTPAKEITDAANNFMAKIREKSDVVIGVHIRRGDYVEWNEGRFFFSYEQYADLMHRLVLLLEGNKVSFFISTNDELDISQFEDFDCYTILTPECPPIGDLYTLSLCDYIIGPPSTFSRWASFYGEKPLYFILDSSADFTLKDFSKVKDYFHFENDTEIYDW